MFTQVFEDSYKGYPVIAIWEIDSNGNKKGKVPIVSFGQKKAQAILDNIEEIQSWANSLEVQPVRQLPSISVDSQQTSQLISAINTLTNKLDKL